MKKRSKKGFWIASGLLAVFVTWTVLTRVVDVQEIGPRESAVGFATLNEAVHVGTGVHLSLYILTDWLGLVPIGIALCFAVLGVIQWIHRKSMLRVDRSILILGIFYLVVLSIYVFFECVVVNYRPVLLNGFLEVSYPSSTTMLVMCIMLTALIQCNRRIKNSFVRRGVALAIIAFVVFMVIGRLLSGVHWLSDIIGGVLLSAGLVTLYASLVDYQNENINCL